MDADALLRALVGCTAAPETDRYLAQLAQDHAGAEGLAILLARFEAKLARLEAVQGHSSRAIAREVLALTRATGKGRPVSSDPLAGWNKLDRDGGRLALDSATWSAVDDRGHRLAWTVNVDLGGDEPNPCRRVRWREALQLLAGLNYHAWCGQRDWRIPRIDELATLTHTRDGSGGDRISARLFPDLGRDRVYWSSTRFEDTRLLQVFDFRDATTADCKPGETAYLRFVRTMGDDES